MTLVMLLAAVALVLLIACANVGNLLFARALGAGRRSRSARRSAPARASFPATAVEALVLALPAAPPGCCSPAPASPPAPRSSPTRCRAPTRSRSTPACSLFVVAASVLTGILAGALPALRAGRTDLNDALKEGGRSDGAVGIRTRRLLIVCEVALSLVLLMGAGVMVRSLLALRSVDAGFDPRNVLTMRVTLPETRYDDAGADERVLRRRRSADPRAARRRGRRGGRRSAVAGRIGAADRARRHAELLPRDQPTVEVRKITPGYLRAMQDSAAAGP